MTIVDSSPSSSPEKDLSRSRYLEKSRSDVINISSTVETPDDTGKKFQNVVSSIDSTNKIQAKKKRTVIISSDDSSHDESVSPKKEVKKSFVLKKPSSLISSGPSSSKPGPFATPQKKVIRKVIAESPKKIQNVDIDAVSKTVDKNEKKTVGSGMKKSAQKHSRSISSKTVTERSQGDMGNHEESVGNLFIIFFKLFNVFKIILFFHD